MFWKRRLFIGFGLVISIGIITLTSATTRAQSSLADDYREAAGRVIGAAMTDVEGWEKLEHLTIDIGHRLSGSSGLERAIDWAFDRMKREELHVQKLPVKVPHWVRGEESARLLAPVERALPILGLGLSVGTPAAGINAHVVAVTSFDELDALGREKVEGKIVLFAVPWMGYGHTVRYRSAGASRAAALGAVAALVRSATGRSLSTPHTGAMRYDETFPKIPAAAVTVEDAEWMRLAIDHGQDVRVHLSMGAQMLPDADSFAVCDFALHRKDAHRHFFPFSDWRFQSPVSYWDPRHYGGIVTTIEMVVVVAGAVVLFKQCPGRGPRAFLGLILLCYAVYIGYALVVWA